METHIRAIKTVSLDLREIWEQRELLYFFVWRDIKVKYKHTWLGIIWVLLQPIALSALFVLVFKNGLQVKSSSLPYPIFVFLGLVLWGFASSSMTNASHSMEINARIISKIYFPRLIVPISSVAGAAFDLLFGLALALAGIAAYQLDVQWIKLFTLAPLGLLLLTFSATGLAFLFSILNAIYKDFRYVIPFVVQLLFFGSGVFYEPGQLGKGWWSGLLTWNPFAVGIDTFRGAFTGAPLDWFMVGKGLCSAALLFFSGLFVFKKLEPILADHL